MSNISRKLRMITESWAEDVKNPNNSYYNRQYAEDMLYHTIGPLSDDPRWSEEWTSPSRKPPEFVPGGKAFKWTQEEVVFAMAGDPSLLFSGSDNPRSPAYGRGGAPLYRLARRVARKYNRTGDRQFIADIYQNGMIPLVRMLQPGFDEARGPFISYAIRTIQSAMEHGTGGTTEGSRVYGSESSYYVTPDEKVRRTNQEGNATKVTVKGLASILKMISPAQVRQAANVVKGKYRYQRLGDKHPDNPFGQFSADYYRVVTQYADALESKDMQAINAAKEDIEDVIQAARDSEIAIRGASTGVGQAISTLDRAYGSPIATTLRKIIQTDDVYEISRLQSSITPDEAGGEYKEITKLIDDYVKAVQSGARFAKDRTQESIRALINRLNDATKVNIQSADVEGDDGGTLVGNIPDETPEDTASDREVVRYIFERALYDDLGKALAHSQKYHDMAINRLEADTKKVVNPDGTVTTKAKIGGPMTAQEFRYALRALGPIASDYPGKGTPRKNTKIPRDANGWWSPGEDPEIEPIPGGGTWTSIWSRNGYNPMGSTEIASEMTEETKEFIKLNIPSARAAKVAGGSSAMTKVSVSRQLKQAKLKLALIKDIYSVGESIEKGDPIFESVNSIDRHIIVETCGKMIAKIDAFIAEEAPEGWEGTVKAMKKHKDIDNPYALAWHMKKKGNKSHYKSNGKKKKKDTMEAVSSFDFGGFILEYNLCPECGNTVQNCTCGTNCPQCGNSKCSCICPDCGEVANNCMCGTECPQCGGSNCECSCVECGESVNNCTCGMGYNQADHLNPSAICTDCGQHVGDCMCGKDGCPGCGQSPCVCWE